jgi:hypothetical protein
MMPVFLFSSDLTHALPLIFLVPFSSSPPILAPPSTSTFGPRAHSVPLRDLRLRRDAARRGSVGMHSSALGRHPGVRAVGPPGSSYQ